MPIWSASSSGRCAGGGADDLWRRRADPRLHPFFDLVGALRLAMVSDYLGMLNVCMGRACIFNEVVGMINAQLRTDIKQNI
jgi:hypothetical protein